MKKKKILMSCEKQNKPHLFELQGPYNPGHHHLMGCSAHLCAF